MKNWRKDLIKEIDRCARTETYNPKVVQTLILISAVAQNLAEKIERLKDE